MQWHKGGATMKSTIRAPCPFLSFEITHSKKIRREQKMNRIILCEQCKALQHGEHLCDKCTFYIQTYCDRCHEESPETCDLCRQARAFIESDDKRQASRERTHRNHMMNIDLSYAEDKKLIVSKRKDALDALIDASDNKRILELFSCLTEIQKRRFVAHYIDGKTYRTIASEEGVNHTKIMKSIEQSRKKLKKFFK